MMTSVLTAPRGVFVEVPAPEAEPETHFLDGAICWHLLGREQAGRLAILVDGGAEVLQVAYLSREGRLFFRSARDTGILDLAEHPRVAFEVDGVTMAASWSIVVRGTVRRLSSGAEILRSGAVALRPARRAEKVDYFEIQPEQISGRLVSTRD